MGLFSGPRPGAELTQRDPWTAVPPIPPNSQQGLTTAAAYTPGTLRSADTAMRRVAVGAAVRLIAGVTASLPLDGFTGYGPDQRPAPLTGPFWRDPDGTGHGVDDWLEQLIYSLALRGNVVGRVLDRDGYGRPTQIMLAHPDTVSVFERPDGPEWRINGEEIPREQIWHRRMFPVTGQRLGMSVVAAHAVQVLQGSAAAEFGLRWFADGAHPSAILQNADQKEIAQPLATQIKARFLAAVRGTREPVVMGGGWTYTPIQVNAEESQFLDTQRYSEAECARIFGPGIPEILGYETGGSLTYANVEQRAIDLQKFTLNRWFRKIERWLSADVLSDARYVKFNRDALLETDLLSRYRAYEIGLRSQFLVPNEPRGKENLPPLPGGDDVVSNPSAAPTPVTVED